MTEGYSLYWGYITFLNKIDEVKKYKDFCIFVYMFLVLGKIYMGWLFLVTCTFMYNAYSIPLRASFQTRYMDDKNKLYWLLADYTADVIYLLDILVFKPRLTYLVSGLNEVNLQLVCLICR